MVITTPIWLLSLLFFSKTKLSFLLTEEDFHPHTPYSNICQWLFLARVVAYDVVFRQRFQHSTLRLFNYSSIYTKHHFSRSYSSKIILFSLTLFEISVLDTNTARRSNRMFNFSCECTRLPILFFWLCWFKMLELQLTMKMIVLFGLGSCNWRKWKRKETESMECRSWGVTVNEDSCGPTDLVIIHQSST